MVYAGFTGLMDVDLKVIRKLKIEDICALMVSNMDFISLALIDMKGRKQEHKDKILAWLLLNIDKFPKHVAIDVLEDALECGAKLGEEAQDAFLLGCSKGKLYLIKILLQHSIELDSEQNEEALIRASFNGHLRVVQYLVQNGFKVSKQAIEAAEYNQRKDIVDYLVSVL